MGVLIQAPVDTTSFREWRTKVVNLLRRNGFKSLHTRYINDEIHYSEYKQLVFDLVVYIRAKMGSTPFTDKQLEEGWSYRNLAYYHYELAYEEMINYLYGWW